MKLLSLKSLGILSVVTLALLSSSRSHGQAPTPSSAVIVFNGDPSKISLLKIDGSPVTLDKTRVAHPLVYPVASGKRDVMVSAEGAEDLIVSVDFAPRQPTLLFADLVPNKDPAKARRFPKALTLRASRLNVRIPSRDSKSMETYALLVGTKPMEIGVRDGRSAVRRVLLDPQRPALVGQGQAVVYVGSQEIASIDSSDLGLYIVLLMQTGDGGLRVSYFEYLAEDDEKLDVARDSAVQ